MLPLNLASTGVLKTEVVLEGPELWEGEVGELLAGTLEETHVCSQGWLPRAPPPEAGPDHRVEPSAFLPRKGQELTLPDVSETHCQVRHLKRGEKMVQGKATDVRMKANVPWESVFQPVDRVACEKRGTKSTRIQH